MAGKRGSGIRGLTIEQRLWRLSEVAGDCWEWHGALNGSGYGQISVDGRRQLVHRIAYVLFVGPIPETLTIDHLCRNRACWRPDHLEAVDMRTNILRGEGIPSVNARKTHCNRGHALQGENLYEYRGRRYCRACRALNMEAFWERTRRSSRTMTSV